jgi:hypothetical protein
VVMKTTVLWDITACSPLESQFFLPEPECTPICGIPHPRTYRPGIINYSTYICLGK